MFKNFWAKKLFFGDISKMQYLGKNLTIYIYSLWNFLSKNVYIYKLNFIKFQATTKDIFTKRYKIARVAPSLSETKWNRASFPFQWCKTLFLIWFEPRTFRWQITHCILGHPTPIAGFLCHTKNGPKLSVSKFRDWS